MSALGSVMRMLAAAAAIGVASIIGAADAGAKHLRLVPPAKVFPWDHPSSDQAVQLVCRTEPAFHSFEQARRF
jgi:hypothetical protein